MCSLDVVVVPVFLDQFYKGTLQSEDPTNSRINSTYFENMLVVSTLYIL